ncbi:hypothetical protein QUF74_07695 [Candidatus Halobeggiatoa sp. HSG11]|nr:hypothetical protein [Candidatus Halobeggiatoa sp. HSG11]
MKTYLASILTLLLLTVFPMQSMGWWWDNDSNSSENSTDNTESLWDSVIGKAQELTDKTIEETDKLSSKVIEQTQELTADTKNLISNNLKGSTEKLQYYKDVMKEAGFKYSGVTANIGLLPGPDFYFVRENHLTKEQEKALLKKYENEMITNFLLKTIFDTPKTLFLPDHIVEEVTVGLIAIPPKISVTMIPITDSGAEKTKDHLLYHRKK